MKIKNLTTLARACILSAIERKESRGAHQREEYLQTKEEYRKITCIDYDGEIKISFEELDE